MGSLLWLWEVANVLQMNVRRGRHNTKFRDAHWLISRCFPSERMRAGARLEWKSDLGRAPWPDCIRRSLSGSRAKARSAAGYSDQDLRRAASAEKVQLLGG